VAANRRYVDEAIIVAALIVFIAVVSWHVAAFVSVGMVAGVAVHASYKSARQRNYRDAASTTTGGIRAPVTTAGASDSAVAARPPSAGAHE